MLDNTTADLAETRKQLSAVDAERTAAAKRSSTLMTQWEERDAARDEELSKLRCTVGTDCSAMALVDMLGCKANIQMRLAINNVRRLLVAGRPPSRMAFTLGLFMQISCSVHCLADCRAQVSELLAASNTARCEADSLRQVLKTKELELEHMTIALAGTLSRRSLLDYRQCSCCCSRAV